jgi:hydroxymethylbilane synthase
MKTTLRIATRKSPLALWQANYIKHTLERQNPKLKVELLGLLTQGDKWLATPLYEIGGKALFVKELEKAIQEHQADIAVHSIKDMPAVLPPGLLLGAICKRDNPYDAFVSAQYTELAALPSGATVGTSSLRRQCQLLALRPDLHIKSLRGNISTRLNKLDSNEYQAIILAATGLQRLDLTDRIRYEFDLEQMLPAAGQGAIGIECRENDLATRELLTGLDDKITRWCVTAERAVSEYLGGSCQIPLAVHASFHHEHEQLLIQSLVGQPDGRLIIKSKQQGPAIQGLELARLVADDLLAQGADKILGNL